MAQYNCRIFLDTGFNAVNIPDSAALLDRCVYLDGVAINVMQNRFLQSVRIRVTWDQIKDADYVRIGTSDYYFITGMTMLANDCCEIGLLYDYVTSAGGPTALNILDGVTTRVHVTDDTFGKYTEDDPLTMPAHPLEIQQEWFKTDHYDQAHTYVEATINLPQTGGSLEGRTFYDKDDQEIRVTVPLVKQLSKFTRYTLNGTNASVEPHTMLYDLDDTTGSGNPGRYNNQQSLLRGISRARELGIEQGAIINQVQIPTDYAAISGSASVEYVKVDEDIASDNPDIKLVKEVTDRSIMTFQGKTGTKNTSINFQYASGARNNRINYGEFTKYGIISCSGESCEFRAEDLKNGGAAPQLKWLADPHTDGKPYFRWAVVNGDSSPEGFFRNCISGLQWKQVPLFFDQTSGTALNTLKYDNDRSIKDLQFKIEDKQYRNDLFGGILQNTVEGIRSGGIGQGIGAAIGSGISAIMNVAQNYDDKYRMYAAQKSNEMSDYLVSNTVTAPQINFPYNSEVMRDFYGNGCLMYRYKYSSDDINRIDKLLTMYGYRYTKALETSDFNNKQVFNFVECSNVQVTGANNHRLPKWMCDGIAAMLKNGVRIWHVLPNPSYYNQNNPNRA